MNKYLLKRTLMYGIPILAATGIIIGIVFALKSNGEEEGAIHNPDASQDFQTTYDEDNGDKITDGTEQGDPLINLMINENGPTNQPIGNIEGVSSNVQIYDPFPTLSSYDFYDYIRVNENGPYFTDEFIAAVTNKVIKESLINDGTIHYSYERVSQTVLKITFVWVNSNRNIYPKVYTFTLNNGNNH